MRKYLTAATLAALLATPTFAQAQQQTAPDARAQAQIAFPEPAMPADEATEAYAAYPASGYGNVIVDGDLVGSDPDTNVRLQLQRDQPYNSAD